MNRIRAFAISAALAIATSAAVFVGCQPNGSQTAASEQESAAAPRADSVWYHASDVALLAKTGRPQLVEFFHPS